ncbi:hypothetical protein M5D96_011024 [Drosophila gunungcola]|uniref:Uncharacterized protein n=1 Tax=Drosophila gunungcola TaxID=103775 RepID=A0A9P9YGJ6_9MUSC|nr:hypothetical protein M5D96_011024 [Drosophila gunungcola]
MLVQQAVVAPEDVDQFVVDEHAVAAPAHGHLAGREWPVPDLGLHVQVDDLVAVGLLLAVVRTVLVPPSAEDVHALLLVGHRRMEVPVAGRHPEGLHVAPLHGVQIERVHIAAELVDLVDEAAEDEHAVADDAGRVAIASAGQAASDRGAGPLRRLGIEAVEGIAEVLVVASAPNVDALLVSHHRVAVALEGHQRVLERHTRRVQLLRHQRPAHRMRIQDVHVDGLVVAVVVASAVAAEAVDEVAHAHRRVIDPLRPTVQVHRPQHFGHLETDWQRSTTLLSVLFLVLGQANGQGRFAGTQRKTSAPQLLPGLLGIGEEGCEVLGARCERLKATQV